MQISKSFLKEDFEKNSEQPRTLLPSSKLKNAQRKKDNYKEGRSLLIFPKKAVLTSL